MKGVPRNLLIALVLFVVVFGYFFLTGQLP